MRINPSSHVPLKYLYYQITGGRMNIPTMFKIEERIHCSLGKILD
jgi:hypothetical protein